jgi:hypothetical protein
MIRVVFLSMLVPVVIGLVGPVYFGYTNGPYWTVVVWAVASAPGLLWLGRSPLKNNFRDDGWLVSAISLFLIAVTVAAVFLAGDSIAYFLARSFSH